MPSNFKYKSGLGSVGAYQMSGVPFVKQVTSIAGTNGAATEVGFPGITKYVIVENLSTAQSLRVGFHAVGIEGAGANAFYWTLPPVGTDAAGEDYRSRIRMDVRVSSIFLISAHETATVDAQVHAGCTTIPTGTLPDNWNGVEGVGTTP